MSTAYACLEGIKSLKSKKIEVKAIQDIFHWSTGQSVLKVT
jgi:hypothetical protein